MHLVCNNALGNVCRGLRSGIIHSTVAILFRFLPVQENKSMNYIIASGYPDGFDEKYIPPLAWTRADKVVTLCLYGKNPTLYCAGSLVYQAWNVNGQFFLNCTVCLQLSRCIAECSGFGNCNWFLSSMTMIKNKGISWFEISQKRSVSVSMPISHDGAVITNYHSQYSMPIRREVLNY